MSIASIGAPVYPATYESAAGNAAASSSAQGGGDSLSQGKKGVSSSGNGV